MAGDHVDDRRRHEERADAARAAVRVLGVGFFDHRQSTDAGTDNDTNALGVFFGHHQAAILNGLHPSGHAVVNECIHMTRLFAGDVVLDIEALDLASEVRREGAGIKTSDRCDA